MDDDSPEGVLEREKDMALFLEPFLTGQPFDLITYRQASDSADSAPYPLPDDRMHP